MKSLLGIPIVYELFGKAIGGHRCRTIFVSKYLRPRPGDKMLDIGCGPADILHYLPGVDYVGIDISPAYNAASIKRFGNRGRFYCRAVTRDAVDEHGTFDIALASGILHHLTDTESQNLFELAYCALKDNGRLVTFDGCYLPKQSPIAYWLLKADRGKFVRTPDQYLTIAKKAFPVVNGTVRQDLLAVPYTHFIMECVKA